MLDDLAGRTTGERIKTLADGHGLCWWAVR